MIWYNFAALKEQEEVNPDIWYRNLVEIASFTPEKRYSALAELHKETIERYLSQINNISKESAAQISSDGRTIKDVVAHIMAWEDWQIQELSDLNIKERIAKGMNWEGYLDNESGQMMNFRDDDDFNAYITRRYKDTRWLDIKEKAIETAKRLQSFFPSKAPDGWIALLEDTPFYDWKLPNTTISVPTGWFIWMISLEHEAIEHSKDLQTASKQVQDTL